jgi:homoserine dehydrogenase
MREVEFVSSCCRIALLGFGTVGSAVARRLTAADPGIFPHVQLTHIFDRRASEKRATRRVASRADAITWTSSMDDVLESDVDVIVEAIGGVEPAAEWIAAALLAGKSGVTANKQVVARHGASLLRLASRQGNFRVQTSDFRLGTSDSRFETSIGILTSNFELPNSVLVEAS